ncbi:MAG: MBL fold metallo-hydrolase, partial [Lachnospiraceae bacterium]|nr:MBL fold metallo-hydrolase [Lachnospiraceae bacterium]
MMKSIFSIFFAATLTLFCISCGFAQNDTEKAQESSDPGTELVLTADVKPASDYTAQINAQVYSQLDFEDRREAEFATRGLID